MPYKTWTVLPRLAALALGTVALSWLAPGRAAAPEPRVLLTTAAERETIYLGEAIRIKLKIKNDGAAPVKLLKLPVAWQTLALQFDLRGDKTGIVRRWGKGGWYPLPGPNDLADLRPDGEQTHDLNLEEIASLYPRKADTYSLTVSFLIEGRLFQSAPVKIVVADPPKLEQQQTVIAKQDAQGGQLTTQVNVGFLPEAGTSRTLLAVVQTKIGNEKLFPDLRTFRLGSGSAKAVLEAGAIAIPGLNMPADAHILVTEPSGKQFYWALSLPAGGVTRSESFPERKVRFLKSETTGKVEVEIK